jgi:hypothetical protein
MRTLPVVWEVREAADVMPAHQEDPLREERAIQARDITEVLHNPGTEVGVVVPARQEVVPRVLHPAEGEMVWHHR